MFRCCRSKPDPEPREIGVGELYSLSYHLSVCCGKDVERTCHKAKQRDQKESSVPYRTRSHILSDDHLAIR